ncbi:MAG: AAA family ATPase [Acidobacteria bacterium]|nr:AAA family ATPase [Acidobacteriota bacterium]
MTVSELVSRFPHAKAAGAGGYAARCPVHEDRVASLSIKEGADGRALLHCHAGCDTPTILAALGLTLADLFDAPSRPVSAPVPVLRSSSAAATYDYHAADGTLLHQVVRGADKSFRQRQPDGDGGWRWSGAGKRVPYRLEELANQPVVWIVEGEKDVETCRSHGLASTCNRGGAGKWKTEETQALVEAGVGRVWVVPDNDVPGRRHAQSIVEQCLAAGLTATLVALPDLPAHGDISDWFAAGGTPEALLALTQRPPAATPADVGAVPDLLSAEQTFQRVGEGRYQLEWPTLGIRMEAAQLHRDRDRDLHGELTVTTSLLGAKTVDGVLLWSSMNFSSQRTRASLATSLAGRSGAPQLDWLGAVETLALRSAQAEAEGQPIRPLADYPRPEETLFWDVSGLPILRQHPMIIFGDGGAAKSYLALHIAATLASRGIPVLYADFEFESDAHRERLERLTGTDMPRNLHYVRCVGPLIMEVDRLQRYIVEQQIQYLVCDSVAFAVPGRPEEAEHASAYFRAVRQLQVGSLHLAHTTKSLEHGTDKPFGSAFWSNGARSVWFVKRNSEDDTGNMVEVALMHRKSNTGRRLPTFGLRLVFLPDSTTIERFDIAQSAELSKALPIWQRIRSLVATKPMTIAELATELDAKHDSVSRIVRSMDLFRRDDQDRVRLATALNDGRF